MYYRELQVQVIAYNEPLCHSVRTETKPGQKGPFTSAAAVDQFILSSETDDETKVEMSVLGSAVCTYVTHPVIVKDN
jgi:hypothetical protein